MKTVIVTGGAGYVGSYVVKALMASPLYNLAVIDDLSNARAPKHRFMKRRCDDVRVDEEVDVLIHLAGSICVGGEIRELWENNVGAAIGMLRNIKAKSVIVASSAAVYESSLGELSEDSPTIPQSVYGHTKLALEHLVTDLHPNAVVLRLFNVAGGSERHLDETHILPLALRATEEKPLTLHGDALSMVRDFVHVEDVADAFVRAIDWPAGAYNIGRGVGITIGTLLRYVEAIVGKLPRRVGPARSGDVSKLVADISVARSLGWNPKQDLDAIIKSAWESEKASLSRVSKST